MTNPSDKDQEIKAWNDGAFPASGGAVLPSFDDMCFLFTSYATTVAEWKDRYRGATYATRLKAAIADMKFAIAEAEKHPEIAPPQTASNEAMVALADECASWAATPINASHDFQRIRFAFARARDALRLTAAPATEVGVREALEFYADNKRYNGPNIRRTPDDPYTAADAAYMKDVTRDGGDIARRALAALRTPPAVAARSGVGGS